MGRRSKKKRSPEKAPEARRRPLVGWSILGLAVLAAGMLLFWGRGSLWPSNAVESSSQPIEPGAFRGYNLLLITLDTVRADYLGAYGSTGGFTPHLDRLAAEGIRFADFQSHVPLTLPAHTSLFSAKFPTTHGVHDNGSFRVDESLPTLATWLKGAGYRTGAFVAAFVLDARFGLTRGFDVYDDYYGEKRSFLSFQQLERRADQVIAPAETFIRESSAEPWFAWIHLFDAHAPYDAPPEFHKRFPNDPYGAEIAYVDTMVGSLLDRLEARDELERTLVVILADHGESLGDHGERTHGSFAYASTLHVPWLIWAKTGMAHQVFRETARQVDVTPTLLDLLGLSFDEEVDGSSLRPYLSGERPYEPKPSYFEALNPHLTQDWAPLRGIIRDRHKLIRLPIPELYDLERDPGETENVFDSEPDLAQALDRELDDLLVGSDLVEPEAPDLETMRELEALGYVTAPTTERRGTYTEADDPKRLIGQQNAYEEAKDLFAAGNTNEAITLLEGLVRDRPQSSQAYQGLAYALHQTGRVREAIATLEGAIEHGVDDLSLLYLLSAYLLETNDVNRAAALLEDLVRRDPEYAEAHNYLGIAYGRLGRSADSRREFERVLELDPGSASTYNNLGSLALAEDDTALAVERFHQALRYDPGLATAHNGLGVAQARAGDYDAAIESWRKTIELNPQQFDALYNLAMALVERAPDDAIPLLRRYASEAPPHRFRADIEKVRAVLRDLEARESGS